MKILRLSSRNIKNLKAVEIEPDGNIVTLSGKNGAGKSAVLDSIFSALTGKRLADPVRHGQERADVMVDMGEFTVRKRWTAKGEAIEVFTTNLEGKKTKYTSPQTFLDGVIGELSFDPLAFQNMDAGSQVELIKKVVGLDFTDLDAERDEVYRDRAVINSQIKESIAHLKNTQAPDPQTPDEEILFKDALGKVNDLRDKQCAYKAKVDEKENISQQRKIALERIEVIEKQVAELNAEAEKLRARASDLQVAQEKVKLPPVVSQDDIREAEIEIEGIEKQNAEIRAAKRYREAIRDADRLKKASDGLTQKLERIDQDKHTRAAAAKMPIEGLALTDEGVIYQGILFDRLSTGQQIRVSTAIGMALNPKLKVVFIREGSLLDSDGLKEIAEMAKVQDYQIFVERCDETGRVGFYIEDGTVTAKDGVPVQNPESSDQTEE